MKYQVVRIDNGRQNPPTGIVSTHRTREAAQAAIDKANRKLRKLPGYQTAWHPYDIREISRVSRLGPCAPWVC